MAKIVSVPDVGNVEFPDEMDDDAISQAIRTQQPSTPPVAVAPTPAAVQKPAPATPTQGYSETQGMESLANPAEIASGPSAGKGLAKEFAQSPAGKFAFPALGAALTPVLGPGGFWAGTALGAAGATGGEAIRELGAEEGLQPKKLATEAAINVALPTGTKYLGGPALRTAARYFPGTAAALQKGGIAAVRKVFGDLPVPDVAKAYETYELQKIPQFMSGIPERFATPTLVRRAPLLLQEVQPFIDAWKMNPASAALKSSVETLEGAMKGTKDLTIDTAHEILRNIGPRLEAAAGVPKGVMSRIYGAIEQDLQAAAKAGSAQAETLLTARAAAKRAGGIGDLKKTLESNIKPVEGTPLYEQVNASPVAEALPKAGSIAKEGWEQKRLREVLSQPELATIREALASASQLPKIRTGVPGLAERLALYAPMAALGFSFGGAPGIVGAAAGAEALRRLMLTPGGMRIVQKLAAMTPGTGTGTRMLSGLASGGYGAVSGPSKEE